VITEWLYSVWVGFASWVCSLLPSWQSGQGLGSGIAAILGPVSSGAYQLGAWIPWTLGATWMGIVMTVYFGSLIVRAVKSFIPTISG